VVGLLLFVKLQAFSTHGTAPIQVLLVFQSFFLVSELRRLLTAWPVAEPEGWVDIVNKPQTDAELERLRVSVQRGRPYGKDAWSATAARKLGLESTFRPRGRPKKQASETKKGT
jgi:hypothetical protein